ncbi:MAG: hypothetical protein Q9187_008840 [Circinaria calcarea]
MSRPSTSSQRNLTLTEELEKLEQSITLTLQGPFPANTYCCVRVVPPLTLDAEIDHNFSRAHRIVTTSILPIVEQYAEHSKNVWEGSKFWKQFFEASANVSLSGYEETPAEDETVTEDTTSQTTPSPASYTSPAQQNDSILTPASTQQHQRQDTHDSSSPFSSPTHSTPRGPRSKAAPPSIATYSSPYETLRREVQGSSEEPSSSTMPSTPRAQILSESTPDSSPFLPPSTAQHRTPANDILLHRVLDKNYRLQATPHTQTRLPKPPNRNAQTPVTSRAGNARFTGNDDLDSSPPMPAPELRAEMFGPSAQSRRIPGVSVMTPAKKSARKGKGDDLDNRAMPSKTGIWDSDSDDDEGLPEGMSPPKTMQFHIPQSKLLKTPGTAD